MQIPPNIFLRRGYHAGLDADRRTGSVCGQKDVFLMLGIIGGTSLLFAKLPELATRTVHTPYGNTDLLLGDIALLMRHQHDRPPHRVNFRANLAALAIAGVDRIVAFGSSGSMNPEIEPGALVIPTDYISLADIPSIHDHAVVHVMPELSCELFSSLHRAVPEARLGGTYVQTRGPRFETGAEIAALSKCADLVGMTLASEATLAKELGIPFAAISTVDNYANGLTGASLSWEEVLEISRQYRERTGEILNTIIRQMA